jgi:hypothetical protein
MAENADVIDVEEHDEMWLDKEAWCARDFVQS